VGHVLGNDARRAWEAADVTDEIDDVGGARREEIGGA
jgi:hypothetical protein